MKTTTKRPVAADYMQRDVVTISPDDTLQEALDLMTENHVTGLPVMDQQSRCIGLITSSDILNYEHEHADDTGGITAEIFDPESQHWESVSVSAFGLGQFGDVTVREVMTHELIWVDRADPLAAAAKRMLDERVHRVLVMDNASRLYGILSAFDFVRVAAEGGDRG